MATRITVIDYGMGNLCSVSKALEHLGCDAEVTGEPARVRAAGHLILPGVGAFGDAMRELERRGLVDPILDRVAAGVPLLGVCLGMQLLLQTSEESPGTAGLGLISGTVRRFQNTLKVPQMGWNTVRQRSRAPLFQGVPDDSWFYFVHSYYVAPHNGDGDSVAGTTDYAGAFPSVLWRDNIQATQFHPEKSQALGLRMLENFTRLN